MFGLHALGGLMCLFLRSEEMFSRVLVLFAENVIITTVLI